MYRSSLQHRNADLLLAAQGGEYDDEATGIITVADLCSTSTNFALDFATRDDPELAKVPAGESEHLLAPRPSLEA